MLNLKFPTIREMANPKRRVINTLKEYLDYIKQNNGYNAVYTSVYNFNDMKEWQPDYNTAYIDQIFFDFDPKIVWTSEKIEWRPDSGYYDMIQVFNYCKQKGYKCLPILTGSGYHLYVACKVTEMIKDKKALIYNAQKGIVSEVNELLGKEERWGVWRKSDYELVSKFHTKQVAEMKAKNLGDAFEAVELTVKVDHRTMGKTDQIARVPFTFNHKCRRYAVPLSENLINLGDKIIKKMASELAFVIEQKKKRFAFYEGEEWDITEHNTGRLRFDDEGLSLLSEVKTTPKNVRGEVPECIKNLLAQDSLGWDLRRIEIIWLRDNGYLLGETLNILKEQLTRKRKHGYRTLTDFEHCLSEEDGNQPLQMYKRENLIFPTWETLKQYGLCPFKDKSECKLNAKGCMLYGRDKRKDKSIVYWY